MCNAKMGGDWKNEKGPVMEMCLLLPGRDWDGDDEKMTNVVFGGNNCKVKTKLL